jgi:aspartate carbamoyltransferase
VSETFVPEPIAGSFNNKHIVSINQFEKPDIDILFAEADAMKVVVQAQGGSDLLSHKLLANLFYEPSTRTSSSFEAAMKRLGGDVIQINNVAFSSVAKGESLPDTVRTLEQYADVIVLRHMEMGSAAIAAIVASRPVINAGDGIGEHPTQALLDLYTIYQRMQKIDGLTVTMVGDLKHGRTVHSLARLLGKYNVELKYVSPGELAMPAEIVEEIGQLAVAQSVGGSLEEAIAASDVLYITRVQKERFTNQAEYKAVKSSYVLTPKVMTKAKSNMIVMHPLPRVGEIDTRVDVDPRAAYFEQMRNGMFVRMALLARVLGKSAIS